MKKRIAANENGGSVSMAIRMPRYVEPQTTYRMSIPSTMRTRGAGSGDRVGIVVWSKIEGV
jgi:hypothetical protein